MSSYNILLKNRSKSFDIVVDNRAIPFTIITNKHNAAYNVFVRELACATKISASSTMTLLATLEFFNKLNTSASSVLELSVDDIKTNIKLSLDNLISNTSLTSEIDRTTSNKMIDATSTTCLASNIKTSAQKIVDVLSSDLLLCAEAAAKLGYFHRLIDVDGVDNSNTLASLDGASLSELEFTEA